MREGRPARLEVQDESLGAFIKDALGDAELEVGGVAGAAQSRRGGRRDHPRRVRRPSASRRPRRARRHGGTDARVRRCRPTSVRPRVVERRRSRGPDRRRRAGPAGRHGVLRGDRRRRLGGPRVLLEPGTVRPGGGRGGRMATSTATTPTTIRSTAAIPTTTTRSTTASTTTRAKTTMCGPIGAWTTSASTSCRCPTSSSGPMRGSRSPAPRRIRSSIRAVGFREHERAEGGRLAFVEGLLRASRARPKMNRLGHWIHTVETAEGAGHLSPLDALVARRNG